MKTTFFLVLMISGLYLRTQAQDISQMLLEDQRDLTKISKTLRDENQSDLFAKSLQVSQSFGKFSTKLQNSSAVSPEYLEALKNYKGILTKANNSSDIQYTTNVLQYLLLDLNLKNQSLPGADEKLSNTVHVKVKAVNDAGTELGGFRVFVKYFLVADDSLFEELNPTNNADKNMLPGWYLFWISGKNGKIAEKSTHVKVNDSNIIIFLIP